MIIENKYIILMAVDKLRGVLYPIVKRMMKEKYGKEWLEMIREKNKLKHDIHESDILVLYLAGDHLPILKCCVSDLESIKNMRNKSSHPYLECQSGAIKLDGADVRHTIEAIQRVLKCVKADEKYINDVNDLQELLYSKGRITRFSGNYCRACGESLKSDHPTCDRKITESRHKSEIREFCETCGKNHGRECKILHMEKPRVFECKKCGRVVAVANSSLFPSSTLKKGKTGSVPASKQSNFLKENLCECGGKYNESSLNPDIFLSICPNCDIENGRIT